jgi:hypothetical protein
MGASFERRSGKDLGKRRYCPVTAVPFVLLPCSFPDRAVTGLHISVHLFMAIFQFVMIFI